MSFLSRRQFLQDSAALAALAGTGLLAPAAEKAKEGKNGEISDRLHVAVVGVHGRGMEHVRGFANKNNCIITTICDADEAVIGPAMSYVEEKQGKPPQFEQDLRKVLEDKSIDIVTIATPNHWHALAAIWSMQHGKDVYVEKPVSHNVSEGRRIVETARKYNRICQTGTQSRSSTGMREAMQFLHDGKLGTVKLARGLCYKLRGSIGKVHEAQPTPKSVNYDLWSGPAPLKPLMRESLHYDWHWQWDYGNGDLGNQGIHEMDKARWGLGKDGLPRSVVSFGGRFAYVDDGETANTQVVVHDYGDSQLIFEVRGLPSDNPYPEKVAAKAGKHGDNFVGNIFHATEGVLVCPSYTGALALSNDGEVIKEFRGGDDHFGNFVKAVRSRRVEDLNADILEGHLSSALCHLGNISYRLGTEQRLGHKPKAPANDKETQAAFERFVVHVADKLGPLDKISYRAGVRLELDPQTEAFINNPHANTLLTREYRKGFEVPDKV
ncbi:MAG TPA: Gfo/Idh/MocA family oxidoreductase [Gemmataceae bacterium]|nr:Gfo/Idh/MocA family oxidoreductase [Gemmataceae bacterium]